MPVEIKMKSNVDTKDQLFTLLLSAADTANYKVLKAAGVNFQVNFYAVVADLSKFGFQNESVVLPASTTGLLKGTVDEQVKKIASVQLSALINTILNKLPVTTVKQASEAIISSATKGAEESVQSIAKPKPSKPIPTEPVKLITADTLCQPTKGTSGGSIYYVVALSPSVKMAARIKKHGTISFRIEGTPSKEEVKKIQEAGMVQSGPSHWSVHFDSVNVPIARCVGAFILGLGINFTEQITSINQIKIEG